jgi:hypothetical protein
VTLNNFIPQIWSARLLLQLHKALVFGQPMVVNRDYEGDIAAAGDTVRITSIGPVTVGNYSKNTDIGNPQILTDAQTTLQISQQKFFNFQIDDVDKAQQMPKVMDGAMGEAAYALANVADQYIAGLYTQAAPATTIGSLAAPTQLAAATAGAIEAAYEMIVDMGVKLDQQSVPAEGRWIIVPPWWEGLMLKDNRFVAGYDPVQTQSRLNGVIGQAAGFIVMKSNNVAEPVTTGFGTGGTNGIWAVMAGSNIGITFANQLASVEAYRPPTRFADAVKGLHLYGAQVVRPVALCTSYVTF